MKAQEFLIVGYEKKLKNNLPFKFRDFLLQEKSRIIDGFSVMGISTKEVPMNIVQATYMLRQERPDLPHTLVPVVFIKTRAICLDVSRSANGDAPLVEVSLKNRDDPRDVGYIPNY